MAPSGKFYDPDQDFESFSGFPEVQSKTFSHIANDIAGEPANKQPEQPYHGPRDRGLDADPSLKNLLAHGERVDLTPAIGTELRGVQLSQLSDAAKDELHLLLAERGVLFFRDQDITDAQQGALFDYFDRIEGNTPEQSEKRVHDIREFEQDWRQTYTYYPWRFADAHSDKTYGINPPALSLLRITDIPEGGGGDTIFTSQYGAYDALSEPLKQFLSSLKAVHSSRDFYDAKAQIDQKALPYAPIETLHPLVITHPVTKWRALYYNTNFGGRIAGLKYPESQSIIDFLGRHFESAQDLKVRFRWEKNSVAIWDGRATLHQATHDYWPNPRAGRRATSKGDIPRFDPASKSRSEAIGVTYTGVPLKAKVKTNGINGH